MSFINKNWQKQASSTLADILLRLSGAMGGGMLINKVFPDKGTNATNTEKTLYNIGGPAMLLVGAGLDVVSANSTIKTVAQGLTIKAAEHTLKVMAPSIAETFGLGSIPSTVETTATTANAALMGAAGTVGALPSGLPEEFDSVKESEVKNDGNPWNEVADNIDNSEVQVKVETEENLSGEDAELLGLF